MGRTEEFDSGVVEAAWAWSPPFGDGSGLESRAHQLFA